MHYLEGKELEDAIKYCNLAADLAKNSKCQKSKNGSVIVKDGKIIGEGWNTPVPDKPCEPCLRKDIHTNGLVELCNAVHAEHNAIEDALEKGNDVRGARMYHARIKNGEIKRENSPTCTTCSRLVLHKGIADFVLIQGDKYALYPADEFNRLSYDYHKNNR